MNKRYLNTNECLKIHIKKRKNDIFFVQPKSVAEKMKKILRLLSTGLCLQQKRRRRKNRKKAAI